MTPLPLHDCWTLKAIDACRGFSSASGPAPDFFSREACSAALRVKPGTSNELEILAVAKKVDFSFALPRRLPDTHHQCTGN